MLRKTVSDPYNGDWKSEWKKEEVWYGMLMSHLTHYRSFRRR